MSDCVLSYATADASVELEHEQACGLRVSDSVTDRLACELGCDAASEMGGSTMLPRAILFDLDDTLIQAYGGAQAAWLLVTHELADDLAPLTPSEVTEAVVAFARDFWADPERHRLWRMRLSDARREIVAGSLAVLAST